MSKHIIVTATLPGKNGEAYDVFDGRFTVGSIDSFHVTRGDVLHNLKPDEQPLAYNIPDCFFEIQVDTNKMCRMRSRHMTEIRVKSLGADAKEECLNNADILERPIDTGITIEVPVGAELCTKSTFKKFDGTYTESELVMVPGRDDAIITFTVQPSDVAERIAKEKEDAERIAKEDAERKAKEDAERKAKEEAERKAKEEAERKAKIEADRIAKDNAAAKEAEKKAKKPASYSPTNSYILVFEKRTDLTGDECEPDVSLQFDIIPGVEFTLSRSLVKTTANERKQGCIDTQALANIGEKQPTVLKFDRETKKILIVKPQLSLLVNNEPAEAGTAYSVKSIFRRDIFREPKNEYFQFFIREHDGTQPCSSRIAAPAAASSKNEAPTAKKHRTK